MWWWGDGWGWLIGALFVVFCMVMMGRMMGHSHSRHGGSRADPRDILAERFAQGEISEDEFEQRKRVLDRRHSVDGKVPGGYPGPP